MHCAKCTAQRGQPPDHRVHTIGPHYRYMETSSTHSYMGARHEHGRQKEGPLPPRMTTCSHVPCTPSPNATPPPCTSPATTKTKNAHRAAVSPHKQRRVPYGSVVRSLPTCGPTSPTAG